MHEPKDTPGGTLSKDEKQKAGEQVRQVLMDALLKETAIRQNCPSPDTMLNYETSHLPQPVAQKVAAHFLSCEACQAELCQIRNLNETVTQHTVTLRWLDKLIAEGKNVLRALQLPMQSPQVALRGDGSQEKTIFEFDDYRLFLTTQRLPKQPARFLIEGQVWRGDEPLDLSAKQIRLFKDDKMAEDSEGDLFGLFCFESVASGKYGLHLELPQNALVIEHFDVP